jgi:hypothetical protein
MTPNELNLFSDLVGIAAAIAGWFLVKWIERRLGCKSDWDLIALIGRKLNSFWQTKNTP